MLETIAIAGMTGSGKSTLARVLIESFPDEFLLLSLDHYFKDIDLYARGPDGIIDWDDPANLLLDEATNDIQSLRADKPTVTPIYDFNANRHPDPYNPGITIAGARVRQTTLYPQGRIILVDSHQALMLPQELIDKALLILVQDAEALHRRQIKHPFITEEYFITRILPAFKATTIAMMGKHLSHLHIVNGMPPVAMVLDQALEYIHRK